MASILQLTTGTVYLSPSSALPGGQLSFTGQAIGDLAYASSTTAYTNLADVAVGAVLASGGVGVAPTWSTSPAVTSLQPGIIDFPGTLSSSLTVAANDNLFILRKLTLAASVKLSLGANTLLRIQ